MNGRVYDPSLARFISADPYIQFPENSQSYNRYSYVLNNPLTYTDPTGYGIFSKLWKSVVRPVVNYLIGSYVCGPPCGAGFAGAVEGYSRTHTFEGAFLGTIDGLISNAIGQAFPIYSEAGIFNPGNILPNAALHAARSCAVVSAQGGECGPSAAAAFVTAALGPASDRVLGDVGGFPLQIAGRGIIGGIASAAAGGRFEDGVKAGVFESTTNALHGFVLVGARLLVTRIVHSETAALATEVAGGGMVTVGGGSQLFKNLGTAGGTIGRAELLAAAQVQSGSYSGRLTYVVSETGDLILGRSSPHITLSRGADVLAAGTAQFVNGAVRWIDNASGHYKPSGSSARTAAEAAFQRAGFESAGKYIERKF